MKWFNQLKIKHKLYLMLLLPIMTLLYFTFTNIKDKASTMLEMAHLEEIMPFAIQGVKVVHQLQHERKLSLDSLYSRNNQFPDKLQQQWIETDQAIYEFNYLLKHFQAANFDSNHANDWIHFTLDILFKGFAEEKLIRSFKPEFDQVAVIINDLEAQRKTLTAQDDAQVIIAAYSQINRVLIRLVHRIVTLNTSENILKLKLIYSFFLSIQELASLEYCQLDKIVVQQSVIVTKFHQIIELVAQQQLYWQMITDLLATLKPLDQFEIPSITVFSQEVQYLRHIAHNLDSGSSFSDLQLQDWLKKQVAKINWLNQIEKQLAEQLTSRSHQIRYQVNANFTLTVVSVFILLILLALFIYFLLASMSREFNQIIHIAENVAAGQLDNPIEIVTQDEIGQLLTALAQMQQQLLERFKKEQQITQQALRINRALDCTTTPILITNPHEQLIYLNESAKHFFVTAASHFRQQLPHFEMSRPEEALFALLQPTLPQFKALLPSLKHTYPITLEVGELTINLAITPIIGTNQERLGLVMELNDRTQEILMAQEIDLVIQAASRGDFHQRIQLDNKSGFFQTISASINTIIQLNQNMSEDTLRIFAALAQGDLTQMIENKYIGMFDQIKQDANATVSHLTTIMDIIKHTAIAVRTATQEISQDNINLKQRTEEQAAALEEIAASMEQMTSTVEQNANNASQATQLASQAKEYVKHGETMVGAVVTAMNEIHASSKKMFEIINLINEVAFQTNLLSLNAAIEAAHAGEQGRGFAIVAAEVRQLAQRTAASAQEIEQLIKNSVTKAKEGTTLVDDTMKKLTQIVKAVTTVSDIMGEIAAANQEQAKSIHYVNQSISHIDDMTQQNTLLVKEIATASESMYTEAINLEQQVKFFKLEGMEIA